MHKANKRRRTGVRKIKKSSKMRKSSSRVRRGSSKMRQTSLTSFFKPRNRPVKTAKRSPVKQMRQGTLDLMLKKKKKKKPTISRKVKTPKRKRRRPSTSRSKRKQSSKVPKYMMKSKKKSKNLKSKGERRKRKIKPVHVRNEPEFKPSMTVPAYRMMRRTVSIHKLPKKKIIIEREDRVEYKPNLGFRKTLQEEIRIFEGELDDEEDYSINVPWLNEAMKQ